MQKEKLIPVICIVVFSIIIVYLIVSSSIRNHITKFQHFSYEYNGEKFSKDDISVNDILVVNKVSFMVVAVEGNRVVLNSSENYIEDLSTTEITVKLNEQKKVCFTENDCITFSLT